MDDFHSRTSVRPIPVFVLIPLFVIAIFFFSFSIPEVYASDNSGNTEAIEDQQGTDESAGGQSESENKPENTTEDTKSDKTAAATVETMSQTPGEAANSDNAYTRSCRKHRYQPLHRVSTCQEPY